MKKTLTSHSHKAVTYLLTAALLLGSFLGIPVITANASTDIIIYSGIIHLEGRTEERALMVLPYGYKDVAVHFKHGTNDFIESYPSCHDGGMDTNGCVWIINNSNDLLVWSYDLTPQEGIISFTSPEIYDVDTLIFKGSGSEAIAVGYKTLSGEEYPLPDFEEIKKIVGVESSIPAPSYIPLSNSTTTPTPTPTQAITPTPIPKSTPTPTSKPRPTKRPTVKKATKVSKTKAAIYNAKGKLTSKLTLKNRTLTWKKGMKKARTYKKVTCVGVVEKSKNIYFMNKKKEIWRVSFKTGKKKLFLRKGKKFVYKKNKNQNYLVQIKTASKKVNMKNR